MFARMIALGVFATLCGSALAQECMPELPGGMSVRGSGYTLSFRTQPETVSVGRHFSVDLAVCANAGGPTPDSITVDGFMPEHRHGMNYRATVKALGGGRFRADGLMFHMPGRWEFRFDIQGQGRSERLTSTLSLR